MARTPSHRRRFLIGLALAALLGVGLGAALLAGSLSAERRERAERKAVVTLSALAAVADRASGGAAEEAAPAEESGFGLGDELAALDQGQAEAPQEDEGVKVRNAVARFAREHPEVAAIRVVKFDGRKLEASTAPEDSRDKAAPRSLVLAEKPLYDLGQKLRAAVEGNGEGAEGAARAPEIAIERRPQGVLLLAAPLERSGEVIGMVQMETRAEHEPAAFAWVPFLAAWIAPVVALLLLSLVLGERRWLLAAAAAAVLVIDLWAYGRYALGIVKVERRASSSAVAERIAEESKKAESLLADLAIPAAKPLEPTLWDADEFRQARGLVTATGVVDEGRLGELAGADAGRLTRSVATLAALSLAVLAFVGLGWAARTGTALVEHRVAYAYTMPALIGMLFLVFFPFFYGIALSFTNANIYNTDKSIAETWVGLANYGDILSDFRVTKETAEGSVWNYQNFYYTLVFTVIWTVANVAIGVTLGLTLALILNLRGFALRPVYRVLLILPWAVPNYITSLIFKGMFHRQFGVVNQIIQLFGGPAVPWFERPFTSFLAVLTTNGWLSFPFMMVISLGALQSIPADLYEAARVDGATRWQQFRSITLPSLRPALVPAVILSVIWTFNMFNVIYLVSAGQPGGATEILITQSYKLAFEQYRYGYAAAYSAIIFLILLAYGTWQNRVTRATEAIG
ncbi:MAG TPA: sugar ABC transporter permease [Thermoanaerobaculia bacterium]|jgi:arabinogalactan oligomer/maltooligosaccharide transport system permease protein|nr:sugar ABC transporter permease [Thermoanaerobaculia bacterium]